MIDMLKPTENFGADQIRFLQKEASEWIKSANESIIAAASNGNDRTHIDITNRSELGNKFYKGADALIEHFKSRGFECNVAGQSHVEIKW